MFKPVSYNQESIISSRTNLKDRTGNATLIYMLHHASANVEGITVTVPLGEGAIVALIDVREVGIVKGAGVIHGGLRMGLRFLPRGDLTDR
jgi:hypothetical protein